MQPELTEPHGTIGPYRLTARLGTGGMGEVFLAYDGRLDRQVAIKRIHREAGEDPQRRERFRREARMAARLSHSAVVQVYDILSDDEGDAIVMEHVSGTNLHELIERDGPLSVERTVALARELADGLDAAHRQGIVHRDFKSENVLITPEGRAKIADFGIAKRLQSAEEEEPLTRDHAVLGTCRSMSPEQARGEPVDHRTDIWAFGVLLYEALSGRSPFAADNGLATLQRVITHRQTPLKELRAGVPDELSLLVDHLLEKNPQLRPATAARVRQDLDRIAATDALGTRTIVEPMSFAASTPAPLGLAPALRRYRVWIAGALSLGLVAAGFAVTRLVLGRPGPPLYVAVLAPGLGGGSDDEEARLLASGVRVAVLQGLATLAGVSPQAFEEVDAVTGAPREIARAVAADELVGAQLDCRAEVCSVSLTRRRGADGGVLWAESFEVPRDDSAFVASAVRARIRQAYADRDLRRGTPDLTADKQDLDALLRLRHRFESRREQSQGSILAGLAAIRRRSPRYLEVYLLESRVLRRRFWAARDPRDLAAALALVDEARKLAPQDPRPLFEQVDVALLAGNPERAEESLEQLEPLVPGDARLLDRRAQLREAQGRGAEALATMRQAARLHPSSSRLHVLAQMEFRQGQPDAARRSLERLLERAPRHVDGLSLLASIELANGDLERAVDLYRRLVERSPGLAELSNLGMTYLFLGRYAQAEEAFRRALQLHPNNPFLLLNLADAELLSGDSAAADSLYRATVEQIAADPAATSPQHLTAKAQALAHLGQGREAVAALQDAFRRSPDSGLVAFEAAIVYTLLGENDSAVANAERAVRQGVGGRWFVLPWFAPLADRPDFKEVLGKARPGLG